MMVGSMVVKESDRVLLELSRVPDDEMLGQDY